VQEGQYEIPVNLVIVTCIGYASTHKQVKFKGRFSILMISKFDDSEI